MQNEREKYLMNDEPILEQTTENPDKNKLLKMHAQNKLCKLWSEATQITEKRLIIINLNRELLTDFIKQAQLKIFLEERIEMLAMLCLLLDPTISNKEKNRFLNGSRVSSPAAKLFKNCVMNTLAREMEKVEVLQTIKKVLNQFAAENGILGGYLLPPSFIAKSVNETLASGVKIISGNVNAAKEIVKETKNKGENISTRNERDSQKVEKSIEQNPVKVIKQPSKDNEQRKITQSGKTETIQIKTNWREEILNKNKIIKENPNQEVSR